MALSPAPYTRLPADELQTRVFGDPSPSPPILTVSSSVTATVSETISEAPSPETTQDAVQSATKSTVSPSASVSAPTSYSYQQISDTTVLSIPWNHVANAPFGDLCPDGDCLKACTDYARVFQSVPSGMDCSRCLGYAVTWRLYTAIYTKRKTRKCWNTHPICRIMSRLLQH